MQTKLVRGTFDISTVVDKRYYDLEIININPHFNLITFFFIIQNKKYNK